MPFAVDSSTAWLDNRDTVRELFQIAPSVARYQPENFYLPERWLNELRSPWDPEAPLGYLAAMRRYYSRKEPVVMEKVPGRNEPCACGSGVKYKRCCAVGQPKQTRAEPAGKKPSLADGIWPHASPAANDTRSDVDPAAPAENEVEAAPQSAVA
jgi:hypothetical protein